MKDLVRVLFIVGVVFLMIGFASGPMNDGTISDIGEPLQNLEEDSLIAVENWLSGWAYRQNISITGQAGAGTNYQIRVPFNYDATGVTGEVNFSSNCQTDFGDIRFTDNDGYTPLDYWIEEKTASDDGVVWVEVADNLDSNQVICVYYGTATTSTNVSSGDDTFIFFDDFSGSSLDTAKWDQTDYTTGPGSAALTFADGEMHSDISSTGSSSSWGYGWRTDNTFDYPDIELRVDARFTGADWLRGGGDLLRVNLQDAGTEITGGRIRAFGDFGAQTNMWHDNVEELSEVETNHASGDFNSIVTIYDDEDYDCAITGAFSRSIDGTDSNIDGTYSIWMQSNVGYWSDAMYIDVYWDLVILRKDLPTEPSITTITSVESEASDGVTWLSGWAYRQEITITGQTGAGANYQIKTPFNYDATGVTGEINFSSNCQTDFGDIRFTDNDGYTALDYWIEEKTNSDDGTSWVEVADDLDTTQTIYVYYGTSTTSVTTSNGEATFSLYEDWDSESVRTDIWDVTEVDGSISYSGSGQSTIATIGAGAGSDYHRLESDLHLIPSFAVRFRSNIGETAASAQRTLQGIGTNWDVVEPMAQIFSNAGTDTFHSGDKDGNIDDQPMVNTYFDQYTVWDITLADDVSKLYADGSLIETGDCDDDQEATNAAIFYVRDSEHKILSDWMIVRKFITTEPSLSSVATPESESADGETWLTGWAYRQKLTIIGQDGAGIDYPIMVPFNYDATGVTGEVNFSSNSETDFDDIRFTDNDGETLLDHWIEEETASDDGTSWVEVFDDLDTTQSIYIYYGNSSVACTSSGTNTFLFFDDFEDNTLDSWTVTEALWSVQSTQKKYGTYAAYGNSGATGRSLLYDFETIITTNVLIHSWVRFQSTSGTEYSIVSYEEDSTLVYAMYSPGNEFSTYDGSSVLDYEANTQTSNTWIRMEIGYDFTTERFEPFINRVSKTDHPLKSGATALVTDINKVGNVLSASTNYDNWVDDFYVRKWQTTEPSITTFGSAESFNQAPVNDETPVCTNLDDGDNLYAHYKEYTFTSNSSDADGFGDIEYVELTFMNGATPFWTVKFDEDNDTFSESLDTNNMITLETSTNVSSGNTLNITWQITIHWNHTDVTDYDLKQYVIDAAAETDTDTYSAVNYDVETRLDYSVAPNLDDGSGTVDRGNYNTEDSITAGGTVIYYGSADDYPPTDEVDVWVSCANVTGTPWSDTGVASGVFSMTVDSDDVVIANSRTRYTFKTVIEGEGSGGTDLYYTTSVTDDYKADSLTITIVGPTDNRQNINANASGIVVSAVYDYDGTAFDGTLTLNDTDYNGDGVVEIAYFTVDTASADTHGVTSIATNDDTYMIWDQIIILGYNTNSTDDRDNIGDAFNVSVWIQYDYDDSNVTDGTIVINGDSFAFNADSGNWTAIFSNATVSDATWDTIVASGNTYGITSENQNGKSQKVIWDRIQVQSYTVVDARVNLDDTVNIDILLYYDYDNAQVTDGTNFVNGLGLVHQGAGVWRYATSFGGINSVTYNDVDVNAVTYGIIVVDDNGQSQLVIWDQIKVLGYYTDNGDNWDNINTAVNVTVWIQYDYDDTNVTDGTVTVNGQTFDYLSGGIWNATFENATASFADWDTVVTAGNTHGITSVNQNSKHQEFVWDSVVVSFAGPTDNRQNLDANASGIVVTLTLAYNGTAHGGAATLNDTDYVGDSVVEIAYFTVSSVNGGTYDITGISTNDDTYMIWDQIKILGYNTNSTDVRDNINDAFNVSVWVQYDYDDTNVTDGTVVINGDSYVYNGDSGNWTAIFSNASISDATWNTVVVSGNTHGITDVNQNGKSQKVIWDQIKWNMITNVNTTQDYGGDGYRVDTGIYINLTIWIYYDYDDTNVTDGTVTMNGESMTYIAGGSWYIIVMNATAAYGQDYTFNAVATSGNEHGITEENQNSKTVTFIWDEIFIDEDDDNYGFARVNIHQNVTLWATAKLRYDNHTLGSGDYIEFGDERMTWDAGNSRFEASYVQHSIGEFTYTINSTLCYEDDYGITVGKNSPVNVIFDRIKIYSMWVNETYIQPGDPIRIWASLVSEFDNESMQAGLVQVNGTLATETAGNLNMTFSATSHWFKDYAALGIGNYTFLITWANWTTYNITEINYNGWNVTYLSVLWDQIIVQMYATNSTDNWDDINTVVNVTVWLEYSDGANVTDGTVTINGESLAYLTAGNWTALFSNATISRAYWDTVVCAGNIRGITNVDQNGQNQEYLWDRIIVTAITWTGDPDVRVDVGTSIIFSWILKYDYNNTQVTTGTHTLNGYALVHSAAGVWRYTNASALVGDLTLDTVAVGGDDVYAITEINQGGNTVTMIWDQIIVLGYNTNSTDNRDNINDYVNVTVWLQYDFDDTNVTDGTVTINGQSFVYIGAGGNWSAEFANATVSDATWDTVAASGNTHGITSVNQNTKSQLYIWDQIIVLGYNTNSTDNWDDINDYVNISVWIQYDYDDTNVTDGTVTVNGQSFAYIGAGGNWSAVFSNATASQALWDTVVTAGNTHGITSVNQNSESQEFVWDSAVITITIGDQRIDVGDNATINFVAVGAYNGTNFLPTFTCNDTDYNGSGVVEIVYFNVTAIAGGTYTITEISSFDCDYVIWDEILILTVETDDSRINNTGTATLSVTAELSYDGHSLGTGDTLYMNNTIMVWNNTHFVLEEVITVVGKYQFYVNSTSANEATYGITVFGSWIYDNVMHYPENGTADSYELAGGVNDVVLNAGTLADTVYNDSAFIQFYEAGQSDGDDFVIINVTIGLGTSFEFYAKSRCGTTSVDTYWYLYNYTSSAWDLFETQPTSDNSFYSHSFILDTEYTSGGFIRLKANKSVVWPTTWEVCFDYIKSLDLVEIDVLGWQHNCSVTTGVSTAGGGSIGSDGDYLSMIADADGSTFEFDAGAGTILNTTRYGYLTAAFHTSDYLDSFLLEIYNGTHYIEIQGTSLVGINTWCWDVSSYGTITAFRFTITDSETVRLDWMQLSSLGVVNTTQQIWDSLTISITTPGDQRITIGANVTTFTITAIRDYDGSSFDGSFTMNDTTYDHGSVGIYYYTVSGVTGGTYGITYIGTNDNEYCIFDQIIVLGYNTDNADDRDNINTEYNISVWVQYDYDDTNVTDGTIVINGEAYAYNSDLGNWTALFQNATVSDATWNTVVASGNTHGITSVNQNGKSQLVIWDQIIVLGYNTNSTDARDDIDDAFNVSVWIQYDYDDTNVTDGTIVINGDSYAYNADSGNWTALFNNATVSDATWNTVVASGNTYGITSVNQNGQSQTVIWDRVILMNIWAPTQMDNRTNVGTPIPIVFYLHFDYDNTNLTNLADVGNVVLYGNYTGFTGYGGLGNYNVTYPEVWHPLFSLGSPNNLTFGLGYNGYPGFYFQDGFERTWGLTEIANPNNVYFSMVFDRVIVMGYTTNSSDNRDNINNVVNVSVWLQYEYDSTNLTDGTVSINGDAFAYQSGGNWTAEFSNATVSDATWNSVAVAGNLWGITVVNQNGKSQGYIWDQIIVMGYGTNSTDNWDDINTVVNLTVWIYYDYDNANVTDGNVWDEGQALAYIGSGGNWSALFSNATPSFASWNAVTTSGNTHGITSIDQNSMLLEYVWDRLDITVAVNMTWTVCGYYANVSFTGEFDYNNTAWSEHVTVANTSIGVGGAVTMEELTKTIVGNYTFYTTVVEDATYDISEFITTTVWCVWDNVTGTVIISPGAEVGGNIPYTIFAFNLTWTYNGTFVDNGWDFMHIDNDTLITTVDSDGSGFQTPAMWIVVQPATDIAWVYSSNATATVAGTLYNFTWYTSADIIIAAEMDIAVEDVAILDTSLIATGTTNVDFDWTIYAEGVNTTEIGTVSGEVDFSIEFDKNTTAGLHNYSIYFDAGASGDRWYNSSYYVEFALTMDFPSQVGDYMEVKGITNVDCEWYVYNRDTTTWKEDGTITGGEDYFQFLFLLETAEGMHNYSLYFNVSSTTYIWKNGTYYINPELFAISETGFDFTDEFVLVKGIPNKDGTSTLYHNGDVVPGGGAFAEDVAFVVFWARNGSIGTHNISLKCVNGTDEVWIYGSYYIGPDIDDVLTITGMSFGESGTNISAYWNTNWFNTTGYLSENGVNKTDGSEATTISYYRATVAGNYNVTLYVYGGGSFINITFTYTVAEDPMFLTAFDIDTTGAIVTGYAETSWDNATITLYENNNPEDTGSEGDLLSYAKATVAGEYNVSLLINGTGSELWFNVSYTIAPPDPMYLLTYGIDTNGAIVTAFAETNWDNTTITLYENNLPMDTGAEGDLLSYLKSTVAGDYNVSLLINGTASDAWVNVSYTIAANPLYLLTVSVTTTGANITGYAETNWNNATLTIYENNLPMDTGAEGTIVSYVKATVAGEYNVSLLINGTASEIWFNITYTVAANPMYLTSFDIDTVGALVSGYAETNWNNATITIYENNSPMDTGAEGDVLIYTKSVVIGDYNVSLLINGTGSEIWFNVSYTVGFDAANFAYIEINLYGPDAIGLDPIMFKIYVNGTRISSNWPRFYNATTATYNITITNFLNETIISPAVDGYYTVSERMIDVSLDVYTFFVYSQIDEEFIYFNLTSGAGATWTGYVPPRDYIKIAIYASTDYTYAFTVLEGGKGGTFGDTINIDADFGIIIRAYNLMDIFRGIQNVGGGGMTEAQLTSALMSAYSGPMGQIQFFSWLSAILIFVGLYAVPYVRSKSKKEGGGEIDVAEIMRTGGASRKTKGETPKQLEPYEFGKGVLNPKYQGKGTGMDDMSEFIWGRLKSGSKSGRKK